MSGPAARLRAARATQVRRLKGLVIGRGGLLGAGPAGLADGPALGAATCCARNVLAAASALFQRFTRPFQKGLNSSRRSRS